MTEEDKARVEEIRERYAPALKALAAVEGPKTHIDVIVDLAEKLGKANQREKVLLDRVAHLEATLLAIELPQGQAYPWPPANYFYDSDNTPRWTCCGDVANEQHHRCRFAPQAKL